MKRLLSFAIFVGILSAAASYFDVYPAAIENRGEWVTVKRVVDGDTFVLTTGERVRLIGVDTPETVHPNKQVEPFGQEASRYSKSMLTGQKVRLEFDVEKRDRYKRLLAYVYLQDNTFYNAKLVQEGFAQVATFPPNVKYADQFVALQREAREAKRGLWGRR